MYNHLKNICKINKRKINNLNVEQQYYNMLNIHLNYFIFAKAWKCLLSKILQNFKKTVKKTFDIKNAEKNTFSEKY